MQQYQKYCTSRIVGNIKGKIYIVKIFRPKVAPPWMGRHLPPQLRHWVRLGFSKRLGPLQNYDSVENFIRGFQYWLIDRLIDWLIDNIKFETVASSLDWNKLLNLSKEKMRLKPLIGSSFSMKIDDITQACFHYLSHFHKTVKAQYETFSH